MKNLLKFEFHKLVRQKSFYICTIVTLAVAWISLLLAKAAANNPDFGIGQLSGKGILLTAINSSNFTMISGIFLALFVCNDYGETTIKNIYTRGFSKSAVYFSKWIVAVCATAIMFAVTLTFTYFAGNAMFDGEAEAGNYAGFLTGQFLCCLACSAFVFAVSLSVKKVGVSIALAILGPSIIGMVVSLVDAFLKLESLKIADYWFDGFIGELCTFATDGARLTVCVVLSVVYAVIFTAVGYWINKKQEN